MDSAQATQTVTLFLVTTVYNGGNRLQRTLDSLLEQTSASFVHYIYEDGSPKPSDAIIQDYILKVKVRKDPYKVIFEHGIKNIGVDAAHQHCFSLCQGTHFMSLDQGDYVTKDFVEKSIGIITKHPGYGWYHFNSISYDEKNGLWKRPDSVSFKSKELKRPDQLPNFLSNRNFFFHHFLTDYAAYRKINPDFFIQDGHSNGGLWYDAQIIFEMLANYQSMYFVQDPLSRVLQDPHSVATSGKYDEATKRQNELFLLKKLSFPEERIAFIQDYMSFLDNSLAIKKLALNGQKSQAVQTYRNCLDFMAKYHLPSFYFVDKKRAHFFASCAKNPLLLASYKKVRHC